MPRKKRGHGHHAQPEDADQSQPSRATPKPAAQASAVKPALFETNTTLAGATVMDMSSAGATVVDMTSAGARGGLKESKTPAVYQVKASAPVPPPPAAGVAVTAVTRPKESPKGPAKSAASTTTVKADVHKVDPAKSAKPVAVAAGGYVSVEGKRDANPTQTKVQVEVPPAAAKGVKEVDPFDALADILPSAKDVAPTRPVYTGPEVTERNITFKDDPKLGVRDSTLPPGYRFENMPPVPADVKPKDLPKPMSTGEALDSLSDAFMTSPVPAAPKTQEKKGNVDIVSAKSAGPANFAPPPVKKSQTPAEVLPVSVCPPADKKAKMEQVPGDFSLKSGLDTKVDTKPKTDVGDSMSLDALSALVDTLPEDMPKPELPKLRPEDIVSEGKHKKEKGVLVGEREDTLPPKYRFNKDELKNLPAPERVPSIDTGEALDFLSGDFTMPSSAPAVKCSVPNSSAPPAQPSADFTLNALAAEFVSSSAAPTVKSNPCAPTQTAPELHAGAGSPLDALDALSNTLEDIAPAPQPTPPPTKDIVKEKEVVEERLIKSGERDDSLPPEYRPTEEDRKKAAEAKAKAAAAPKKKTMDDKTALDLLSTDFSAAPKPAASSAPPASAAAPKPAASSAPPASAAAPKPAASSAVTTKLESPVLDSQPLKPMSGAVLDSLSDTLLPNSPEFKSKSDKPKKSHAEDPSAAEPLPARPSSDVVPKSTKKGGRS